MEFEWHAAKDKANLRKHGVSFDEAKFIFDGLSPASMIVRTTVRCEK